MEQAKQQRNGAFSSGRMSEDGSDEINLGELIGTVLSFKWLILILTAAATIAGLLFAFSATPIYRADALLQVDEKGRASLSMLKDLEPIVGDATSVAAELEILNSRLVLGRAIDKLGLDIVAEPRYFPLVGGAVSRRFSEEGLRPPVLGLSDYAWGGERINVVRLEVPAERRDEPLTLVALDDGGYRLLDAHGEELLSGATARLASKDGLSILVSELQARPGTQFDVARLSSEETLNRLRDRFATRERGRKSGIIEASLTGPDRALLPVVLDEIVGIYYRQNVERRSTEAENQLKFLETQLPTLKAQLDAAESAYNTYRQSRGSVDLDLETQSVLKSLVDVDTDIAKLRQEREDMRQGFTPQHPRVMALDAKLKLLNDRRTSFDRGVARLPDTQQTALRLRRDVDVSTTLYIGLLSTAQQLRVTKAGTVGEVRIIDPSTVGRMPVEPRKSIIVALALLLGLLLSLSLVWLMRSLRVTVEDPDTIEKKLGLPVFASIPHSNAEKALGQRAGASKVGLLAASQPEDDAVESLRSLRTTLHFAMLDAPRRSLLVTGPSQDIGKSFVSKNLAAVLAQSGMRVVVIDADLRKGHIHKEFGWSREGGVSEYIAGELPLNEIIRTTEVPDLSVITTGRMTSNPSELLMHPRFGEMLAQLEGMFDFLVVDAPPILAVADAAIVGRHTGATVLLARAGRHPIRELEQAVKRLEQAGVRVNGIVFNDLDVNRQRYRYGYEGYVYRYTYKKT